MLVELYQCCKKLKEESNMGELKYALMIIAYIVFLIIIVQLVDDYNHIKAVKKADLLQKWPTRPDINWNNMNDAELVIFKQYDMEYHKAEDEHKQLVEKIEKRIYNRFMITLWIMLVVSVLVSIMHMHN